MAEPMEALSVFAMSTVKFAISPMMAYGFGFGFLETFLITSSGGCLGVLFFYRSSDWLMRRSRSRRDKAVARGRAPARNFTRANRIIVKVKRRQGMRGLALLTPVIISIPIGTVIAAKYFHDDRRTLPMLMISVLMWAMVLSSVVRYFQ
jgi:hypothetical protein